MCLGSYDSWRWRKPRHDKKVEDDKKSEDIEKVEDNSFKSVMDDVVELAKY